MAVAASCFEGCCHLAILEPKSGGQVEERYVNLIIAPNYLANDFQAVAHIKAFEHFVEAVKRDATARKLVGRADQPCVRVFRPHVVMQDRGDPLSYPGRKYRLEVR